MPADTGAPFDRPHPLRELPARGEHPLIPIRVCTIPALRKHLLVLVDDFDRGRPLVRIHPDHHASHTLGLLARTLWTISEEGNATSSRAKPS
jgi:hypothetical protein